MDFIKVTLKLKILHKNKEGLYISKLFLVFEAFLQQPFNLSAFLSGRSF